MRQTHTAGTVPLAFIAGVAVAALVFTSAFAVFAMARDGWGMGGWGMMGNGHMQGMMGGGTNSSDAPLEVGDASESIAIRNFAFAPGNLQIPVGAVVEWTNYDAAPHSATARDGSWDSGLLKKGAARTLTFDRAGAYEYYCTLHPNMVARLTVQ